MGKISVKKIVLAIFSLLILFGILLGLRTYFRYLRPTDIEQFPIVRVPEVAGAFQPIEEENASVAGMVLASENENLKLYINVETTEVAVYDKKSEKVYYSNPQGREADSIANPLNKALVAAQIELDYYDSERRKNSMNNYSQSIENGQFLIEGIEGGIRVVYTIGNLQKGIESLPQYITEERFQEMILSRLSDAKQIKDTKKQYVASKSKPGFLEIRSVVAESKIVLKAMLEAFAFAGYSEEDLAFDNEAAGIEVVVDQVLFTIPIDYQLKEDRLVAGINMALVEESELGQLAVIRFLNYFGAGNSTEEGYLLVPNGSGALIEYNNGKVNQESYYQQVYGIDPVVQSGVSSQVTTPVTMPIYGAKTEDTAIFARITEGDAVASVIADISGKVNDYNHVGPLFTVRDYEKLSMFGTTGLDADLPVLEEEYYQGVMEVQFCFLSGEEASYSGMAKKYREWLIEEGSLTALQEEEIVPFYLDILGAFEKKEYVMGIPYFSTYAMTTFSEAYEIAQKLQEQGTGEIKMRYTGWFNDGYFHDVARNIDTIGKIGGTSGLESLSEKMKSMGGELYPDVAFQQVAMTSDGYNPTFESSRYIAGVSVQVAPFNQATYRMYSQYEEEVQNIVSAKALVRHVDGFIDDYLKLSVDGLALRDLGSIIASDKKKKDPINREWAKAITIAQIEKLSGMEKDMMFSGGNEYSWTYASDLIDVALGANPFYIIDHEVPFLQMVIHGYMDYASSPANVKSGYEYDHEVLRLLEYGSAPRFLMTYEDSSKLKMTSMSRFYSTHYETWLEEAQEMYNEVAPILSQVRNIHIAEHLILEQDVHLTRYDNGLEIYVNYKGEEAMVTNEENEEIHIPAMGYVVKGGKTE